MAGESLRSGMAIVSLSARRSYKYLGMVMFTSLVWFVFAGLPSGFLVLLALQAPAVVTFLLLFLGLVFLAAPVTAAVYSVAGCLAGGEDVAAREIWARFRRHYFDAAKVTAAMLFIAIVLVVDILFFMRSEIGFVRWLGALWLYFVLFWIMMANYIFPLLVHQQVACLKVLQRAALLALDNVVVTLLVLLAAVVLIALSYYLVLPMPLVLAGMLSLLQATALSEVLKKYGTPAPPTDTG